MKLSRKRDKPTTNASLLSPRRTPQEAAQINREANRKLREKVRPVAGATSPARKVPDMPTTKRNLKAAVKLSKETARQLFPEWIQRGVLPVIKPKKVQRIPIGEALLWRVSYGEVIKWDHESLHYEAVRSYPLYAVPMRFCDCLHNYCLSKWGQDRGDEVFQNVILDVLNRDKRDLRRSEFHRQYNKTKPHRQKKTTGKKNRFLKPVFQTQESYWQWLLKLSTQANNNWRKKYAADFPARGRKLLEES